MRMLWVTRSFLSYRVPVYAELADRDDVEFQVVYSGDYVPAPAQELARATLGERARPLHGEWRIGREDRLFLANHNLSVCFHPGVYGIIRRYAPDVIVADGFFKWTVPAILYRMRHRHTPLVVCYERTAHTERHAQWYRTGYRRQALRFIDAMVGTGKLCRDYAISLGMAPARITVGHMTADVDYFARETAAVPAACIRRLRAELDVPNIMLLYVGQLTPRKGCVELLRAWQNLEHRRPAEATLVFVGDGPQKQELADFCAAHRLHNVRFHAPLPNQELPTVYAAADAFVIPTLEDNWSLVVPEAMAGGLPVLCSIYNGCWPELVRNGENGWTFDPRDRAGTTATLSKCIDNASNLTIMGAASRRLALQHTAVHAADAILEACRIATRHCRNL